MNTDWYSVIGVLVVLLVLVGIVLLIVLGSGAPEKCPECGGDLVMWTEGRHVNGYDVVYRMRGCPKVRDQGAGSPANDRWWRHYSEVTGKRHRSNFDDQTGAPMP